MEPYDILQFPTAREIVVDAGYLGTGRHIIHALVEVDVTLARQRLQDDGRDRPRARYISSTTC